MPTYEVRNKRAKLIIAEVNVADPVDVLQAAAEHVGFTIEELIGSLGNTADEAKAALEIVEVEGVARPQPKLRIVKNVLPRRSIYGPVATHRGSNRG